MFKPNLIKECYKRVMYKVQILEIKTPITKNVLWDGFFFVITLPTKSIGVFSCWVFNKKYDDVINGKIVDGEDSSSVIDVVIYFIVVLLGTLLFMFLESIIYIHFRSSPCEQCLSMSLLTFCGFIGFLIFKKIINEYRKHKERK